MFNSLISVIQGQLESLYGIEKSAVELSSTTKDFEGDITLVVFPYLRASKQAPHVTAEAIGQAVLVNSDDISSYNVVKGFLNFSLSSAFLERTFDVIQHSEHWGHQPTDNSRQSMVEFSSPNTNKPLHLGHIRNNLLGHSVSQILKASGQSTTQVQIINDRGVHICKSMWAWQQFGQGETPESTGIKGDHFVGKYYVRFNQELKIAIAEGESKGLTQAEAAEQAPCTKAVQAMLLAWEQGDSDVRQLWSMMNAWVYKGFEATYNRLGVSFHRNYYESDTYVLGKRDVETGLENGVFYRRDDGSVWIDLTADGMDEKLVLRSDGTSVYMTQDIGTAIQRFIDYPIDNLTYVVGNEQDYHFKVLFLILAKLGYAWASSLHHLSYGMVNLPDGRMKSREGTAVDADDLLASMEIAAKTISDTLGKTEGLSEEGKQQLYRTLGDGALKYFILKVDPKKTMVFNPEQSIEFTGNTGPFIQYSHARIRSIIRRGGDLSPWTWSDIEIQPFEGKVIMQLMAYPTLIQDAAKDLNPSSIANYLYELAKGFNAFYQNHSILKAETPQIAAFRVALSIEVAAVLKSGLLLLGIESPEQM